MSDLLSKLNTSGPLVDVAIDGTAARWVGERRGLPVTATPGIVGVITGAEAAITAEATQNQGPTSVEDIEAETEATQTVVG